MTFIDAARQHLTDHGFQGFGVNALAEASGFDKVLLYRYFGNLSGLLSRLADDCEFFPTESTIRSVLGSELASIMPLETAMRTALAEVTRLCLAVPLSRTLVRWEGASEENALLETWKRQRLECAGLLREILSEADTDGTLPSVVWFDMVLRSGLRAAVIDGMKAPWEHLVTWAGTARFGQMDSVSEPFDDELPVELL